VDLVQRKGELQAENHRLSQVYLSLERRRNAILDEVHLQKTEREQMLEERRAL
jgi:hypothetical protein